MRSALLALVLVACGSSSVVATASTPGEGVASTPTPTPGTITTADASLVAQATSVAVRVDPPTVPSFDATAYVNSLPYGWQSMDPAMDAYRVVALSRGWDELTIATWAPFVFDVIVKESGGCPNTIGGDLFVVGTCDQYTRRGHAEDSGMGQVTTALYGHAGVLCVNEGLCSQAAVIATPWSSMVAVVATLEQLGSAPWCYDARARSFHDCSLIGREARP